MRQGNRLLLTFIFAAMLPGVAKADLLGTPAEPPALSATEQAMIIGNPDLKELSSINPWLLRAILDNLNELPRDASGTLTDFGNLGPYEVGLLGRNPALLQVYSASPEAAAELLALIKAAGGKQGKELGEQ